MKRIELDPTTKGGHTVAVAKASGPGQEVEIGLYRIVTEVQLVNFITASVHYGSYKSFTARVVGIPNARTIALVRTTSAIQR